MNNNDKMYHNLAPMNHERIHRLDRIYRCARCGTIFLFPEEVETHKKLSGHAEIPYTSLSSWAGRIAPVTTD